MPVGNESATAGLTGGLGAGATAGRAGAGGAGEDGGCLSWSISQQIALPRPPCSRARALNFLRWDADSRTDRGGDFFLVMAYYTSTPIRPCSTRRRRGVGNISSRSGRCLGSPPENAGEGWGSLDNRAGRGFSLPPVRWAGGKGEGAGEMRGVVHCGAGGWEITEQLRPPPKPACTRFETTRLSPPSSSYRRGRSRSCSGAPRAGAMADKILRITLTNFARPGRSPLGNSQNYLDKLCPPR